MPLGFARSILTKVAAGASEVRQPAADEVGYGGVAGQHYNNTSGNLYSVNVAWGTWGYTWADVRVGSGSGTPPDTYNTGGWTYYKGTQTWSGGSIGTHWGIYRIQD